MLFFYPGNMEIWQTAELSLGAGLSAAKRVSPRNPFTAASPTSLWVANETLRQACCTFSPTPGGGSACSSRETRQVAPAGASVFCALGLPSPAPALGWRQGCAIAARVFPALGTTQQEEEFLGVY